MIWRTLLCASLLAILSSAGAAHPKTRWFRQRQGPPSTDRPVRAAERYLTQNAQALQLEAVQLEPRGQVRRWRNHRVVRFGQHHRGLRVFDRGVLVRLTPLGSVATVVTFVAEDLQPDTLLTVSQAEALAASADYWGVTWLRGPRAELGILDDDGPGIVVWRIHGRLGLVQTRTDVDAITGTVLRASVQSRSVLARVYTQNPTSTPTTVEVELANLTGDGTRLQGRAATVYHYGRDALGDPVFDQLAVSDGTGFYYNPLPTEVVYDDPFAEVNLYYHVDRIDSYFRDVHGHLPVRELVAITNYTESPGEPYHNAFFAEHSETEAGLYFGQGVNIDFAYDGDAIYHEFGHFVIDEISQMGYVDALLDELGMHFGPGGLHEGLADYFSCTVMDDSVIGEFAFASLGLFRDLNNDRVCPDDVVGEPHDDGWIIGGVTWDIRTTLGASQLADHLVFGALTMLSPLASFADFATALTDTAEAMQTDGDLTQSQVDAIGDILRARRLDICDRILPLDGDAEWTTSPFGFDWLARVLNSDCETVRVVGVWLPGAFQYRIDVPPDAQTLQLRVRTTPADRLLWRLVLRRSEPVGFTVQPVVQGLNIVYATRFDHEYGEFESPDQTVTLTVADDPPLVPGETYYAALLHQHCPATQVTITGGTSPTLPDGGPDTEPSDGGCACAQAPGPNAGLFFWFLLIAAVLSARRALSRALRS